MKALIPMVTEQLTVLTAVRRIRIKLQQVHAAAASQIMILTGMVQPTVVKNVQMIPIS